MRPVFLIFFVFLIAVRGIPFTAQELAIRDEQGTSYYMETFVPLVNTAVRLSIPAFYTVLQSQFIYDLQPWILKFTGQKSEKIIRLLHTNDTVREVYLINFYNHSP